MNFNLTPYAFQREAVDFMKAHPRCINGSEMGVGKTIEALKFCQELDLKHVLIIVPKTLVSEWFYQTDVVCDEGALTPHENSHYEHRLSGLDLYSPRFVVVNYDLLTNPLCWDALHKVKWDCIILDECHKIKNHKAKRTQALYLLTPGVPRVVMMSGTPVQNSPTDLFPLFHTLNPQLYKSYKQWVADFCVVVLMKVGNKYFNQIVGAKNQEYLQQLLTIHMIRHTKKEVLKDLPDKQYRVIPISLGAERAQYDTMKQELFALLDNGETITAPAVIAQLIRLRQICLDPNLLSKDTPRKSTPSNKTQTLLELIEDTPEKIVVYSWFEKYVRILEQELNERKIPCVTITGTDAVSERSHAVHAFQNDPNIRICLGTIGAAGLGITLTASHTAIFTDRAWNPAVNWQAEDRLHRITQKNAVLIIDLFNTNTVEEHVLKVIRRKEQMIEKIVTQHVISAMRKEN